MQNVLILFGGQSSEHEVSVLSARNIVAAIDQRKYALRYVYITKTGEWVAVDRIDMTLSGQQSVTPQLGTGSFDIGGVVYAPDVIFPILHGSGGEDGSIQGLAQLLHIPVVGCGIAASAAAMNKYLTKQLMIANSMTVTPFTTHRRADGGVDYTALASHYGPTLFVKPAGGGSSVGVSKVRNQSELDAALKSAHADDDLALIETAIDAREIEVAVLGNYPDIQVSSTGEIQPDAEFYSYESKYAAHSTSAVIIPADIGESISEDIRRQAKRIYEILGCCGLARVDFFVDKTTQHIYFNEINTMPGFTSISMYPKLWNYNHVSYRQLIERLIELAIMK